MELRHILWFVPTFGLTQLLRIPVVGDLLIPLADRLIRVDMTDANFVKIPLFHALILANLRTSNTARALDLTEELRAQRFHCAPLPDAGTERDFMTLGLCGNLIEIYQMYDVPTPTGIVEDLRTLARRHVYPDIDMPDATDHASLNRLVRTIHHEMNTQQQ